MFVALCNQFLPFYRVFQLTVIEAITSFLKSPKIIRRANFYVFFVALAALHFDLLAS